MTEHVLKIHPKPFRDLESGVKTGEVRNCADRDFKVGDGVRLMMIDETGNPTGNEMHRQITHIQTGYGLPDEICVLSYGKPLLHPIQQTLRDNGDLIALQATVAQQAQMIEHLRGGPTPLYTSVDMTTAAAGGFRDGAASVVVELPQRLTHDGRLVVVDKDGEFLEYCDVIGAIIAAGGRVK